MQLCGEVFCCGFPADWVYQVFFACFVGRLEFVVLFSSTPPNSLFFSPHMLITQQKDAFFKTFKTFFVISGLIYRDGLQ